ncbi:MAG: beta-ketoacyl-[acyl-carrier-protein] synthase family protein [Steroidobacteraceae bacterium]
MTPTLLTHYTATTCLGHGMAPLIAALREQRGGLVPCEFETARLDTYVGVVAGLEAEQLPRHLRHYDCRNNRLAQLGLRQDGFLQDVEASIARVGRRRFGLFLGTSTSGIQEAEFAYRNRDAATGALPVTFCYPGTHNTYSVAAFLRELLEIEGPTAVISTACSSSAKVFGNAARMLQAGLIDAALVGGVDSLCLTTLYGFHSLQLTARGPCCPFAADRDGLSIGEAAAFALLQRVDRPPAVSIALLGIGESNDAHHLSAPRPDGLGATLAMQAALREASLEPHQIDYVNLHGTATPSNDRAEGRAVASLLGAHTPCSSTKGATGHTLGAAGALEALISAASVAGGFMPGGINTSQADPSLGVEYLTSTRFAPVRRVLSNSFGFGGTNCSLVIGRLA